MKVLKANQLKDLKLKLLNDCNYTCPICGKIITEDQAVVDHLHRLNKSQTPGENGYGMIRGVICRNCNLVEGKLANALRRYLGITDTSAKVQFLNNLITYYQKGTTEYLHPSEKLPVKKVSKRQYNKLKKAYNLKKKFPDYPKSGKLTKNLEVLFNKFNINPYL